MSIVGVTVQSKRNVREDEEEMAVHSSSTAAKGHQMSVLSKQGFQYQTKVLIEILNAVEPLVRVARGCYGLTSGFEGILRNSFKIAVRKISLTPTEGSGNF